MLEQVPPIIVPARPVERLHSTAWEQRFDGAIRDGVARLLGPIELNGQVVPPEFAYLGGAVNSASMPQHGYGKPLYRVPVAEAPNYGLSAPYHGDLDGAVEMNASDRYTTDDPNLGQLDEEDGLIEAIAFADNIASTEFLCGCGIGGVPSWILGTNGGFRIRLDDGATATQIITLGLSSAVYYYLLFVLRYGALAAVYVNGALNNTADISAIGSVAGGGNFTMGAAFPSWGSPFAGRWAYLGQYKRAGWLSSHLVGDFAAERFELVQGMFEGHLTNACDCVVGLPAVDGDGMAMWQPNAKRIVAGGMRVHPAVSSKMPKTEDLAHAAWQKTRVTVTPNDVIAPNGEPSADKLVEDSTPASTHWSACTFTALDSTTYRFWRWARADERTMVSLSVLFATSGWQGVNYDLGAGSFAVYAGSPAGFMEDWGGGWYRCGWTFTTVAGDAGATNFYQHMMAGGTQTYDGDGASGLHLWGGGIIEASDDHDIYIPNTGTGTATALATKHAITDPDLIRRLEDGRLQARIEFALDDVSAQDVAVLCPYGASGALDVKLHATEAGVYRVDVGTGSTVGTGRISAAMNLALVVEVYTDGAAKVRLYDTDTPKKLIDETIAATGYRGDLALTELRVGQDSSAADQHFATVAMVGCEDG